MRRTINIQECDFDPGILLAKVGADACDPGALVSFLGLCRNENGMLSGLEIEAYPEMAELEIGAIVDEAEQRWPLETVHIVHRFGRIMAGERIVFIAVASRHRDAAFHAAQFIMDFLKHRAPFWKRAIPSANDANEGGWIDACSEDEMALTRWSEREVRPA